jgi:Nitrile hydratase, alpha chain
MASDSESARNAEEMQKKWAQLVAQAWSDEAFKARLIENASAVLRQQGIDVPVGIEVRVVENTDKVNYLVLPPKPAGDVTELTSNQLSQVAAGASVLAPPCYACRSPSPCIIGPGWAKVISG